MMRNRNVEAKKSWYEELFGMDSLKTIQRRVHMLRADHMVTTFLESVLWPLRRLYLRLFQTDR